MTLENHSFDTVSLELLENLFIACDTYNKMEISSKTRQKNNMDASLVKYESSDEEEIDTKSLEYLEPTLKFKNPRHKRKQANYTYKTTVLEKKVERKLSSCYKMDLPTTLILEKLLDVRSLGQYHDVIAKGRSSVVISCGYTNIKHDLPSYCKSFSNAVKIYKLSNDECLNKIIYKRVEREFENMKTIRFFYFRGLFPYPVSYHKNIIVMSMIGTNENPAQQLGSISADFKEIYDLIRGQMKNLFECQYVHGKLCAENILVYQGSPYYVGMSHCIWIRGQETKALKKLMAGCCFLTKFFRSKNVPVMTTEALFKHITSYKEIIPDVMDVILKKPRKIKCHGNPNREREFNAPSGNCRFK